MNYMRIILILFCVLLSGSLYPQANTDFELKYRNGKELFDLGSYKLAMEELKPVTNQAPGNRFDEYASYFYALAAYRSSDTATARNMFNQIIIKYPEWEKTDEARYWAGTIYFQQGDYYQGLNHLKGIQDTTLVRMANEMKRHYLLEEDQEFILRDLYERYPDDRSIGYAMAQLIHEKPFIERDFPLLEEIITRFEFDPNAFDLILEEESVFKDKYNVAVLLPFLHSEMQPVRGRRSNQFILDIYEGIRIAVGELKDEDIDIELFAYDTQRDSTVTDSILHLKEFKSMDLIIGPLFPGPVALVTKYAFENRINMFNPLSTNIEVIRNNPFAFLVNPVAEFVASKCAYLTRDSIRDNLNAFIYYEDSPQDSLLVSSYRSLIEQDSFQVIRMRKIDDNNSNTIFTDLAATLDLYNLSREKRDSIEALHDKEISEIQIYLMKRDSIGHIFAPSDDRIIASNVISAVNARPDSIQIIGSFKWLDYNFIDYVVAERLGAWFVAQTYIDRSTEAYNAFIEKYVNKHRTMPSDNLILSYDMMRFLGHSLDRYGTLFQYGLKAEGRVYGYFRGAYNYSIGNYNAYLPILRLRDSQLEIINDTDPKKLFLTKEESEDQPIDK